MSEAYTHSTWRVKPGLENEFVQRWEDLAHWSALQGLTSRAKLLRDIEIGRASCRERVLLGV